MPQDGVTKIQEGSSVGAHVSYSGQSPLSAAARAAGVPCSWNQEQLYLLHQQLPNKCTYNEPCGISIEGRLDLDGLQQAFGLLISRHEALRTGFVMCKDSPLQFVMPIDDARPHLHLIHLADLSHSHVQAALRKQAMRPFDLANPPLLRAVLAMVRLNDLKLSMRYQESSS